MEESVSEEKNNDVSSEKKGRGRPRKSEGHLEESAATTSLTDSSILSFLCLPLPFVASNLSSSSDGVSLSFLGRPRPLVSTLWVQR
jgi:hypothetical protein